MQEHKWSSSSQSHSMTSYMPLPYAYNGEYPSQPNDSNENILQLSVSPPLQQRLMSIAQPETPRPTDHNTTSPPPGTDKMIIPPNLIRRRPPIPARPANFTTTTFHSNPYPSAGPIRRRRTESIFSFEMGPTFSSTKQLHDLCNMDQSNSYQVQLYAKMDRGFFRADQDWTCYRRNYFQVNSTFDVHGMNYLIQGPEVPCLLRKNDSQEMVQVDYFSIGVSARVANHDKKIDLVQHTPKRDKGPQIIPEPRPVRAGGNLHLASVGSNHNIVTFERLQFKTATANNGKRRAAQQYYEIVVDLYANFARGEPPIRVATSTSASLVVRGRSPGHYADSHTRFKHIDGDAAKNEPTSASDDRLASSVTTASTSSAAASSTTSGVDNSLQHQASPSHRYTSLPNSPISDFGPYSPYSSYPYSSLNGYPPPPPPPMMHSPHPPNTGLSQYAAGGPPPAPYFQSDSQHHHHPPPPPPTIYDHGAPPAPGPYNHHDSKVLKTESGTKPPHSYWKQQHHQESTSSTYNNNHMYNMNDPYGRHQEQ